MSEEDEYDDVDDAAVADENTICTVNRKTIGICNRQRLQPYTAASGAQRGGALWRLRQ